MLSNDVLADRFRAARLPSAGSHLDTAACGRASRAVLDAVAAHARHEAEIGGYVAQVAAAPFLDAGRAAIAGLLGFAAADDVVFVESASVALATLINAWPLPEGSRVAVAQNEYGPNLAPLEDRGLVVVPIAVDGDERLDLEALQALLSNKPPALVHLCQVSSHRGVVQPVEEIVRLCHAHDVPVILDAAQSLGQVAAASEADAAYSTSRKWLCGPRGVGVLAVRPELADILIPRAPALGPGRWPLPGPAVRRLESSEAHIAGRVGLAVAVGEFLANDPLAVFGALADVGRRTRLALGSVPGWQVVEPVDEPCAITTLRPAVASVEATRATLLTLGFVTTIGQTARAPMQMTAPVLRVSPHCDVTDAELESLADALAGEVVGAEG